MLKNSGQLSQLNPKHITQQTNVAPKDGMWKGLQQEHSWKWRRRRKNIFLLFDDKVLTPRWSSAPPPPLKKQGLSGLLLLAFIFFASLALLKIVQITSLFLSCLNRRGGGRHFWKLPALFSISCTLAWKCLTCRALQAARVCVRRLFRLEFGWFRL